MTIFNRVIRGLLFVLGLAVGVLTGIAYYFSRRLVAPPRQPIWRKPDSLNMPYEEVDFPARGGYRLVGWFIPAAVLNEDNDPKPTLIMVHGYPWNRLGYRANSLTDNLDGSQDVDLLRLASAFHEDGYHVLMYDARNHGESAAAPPVTVGVYEAADLLGALDYVSGRSDVATGQIGVIGFSMGGNTVLYAAPEAGQRIRAAVAVQPTSVAVFTRGYARYLLGPLGAIVAVLVDFFYQRQGGLPLADIAPARAASHIHNTPTLFIQGTGDRWGSVDDVASIAAAMPDITQTKTVWLETHHRFDGYNYIINHPEIPLSFFAEHLL